MALIHFLQTFAAMVSARDTVVVLVFATTLATAVFAFYREPGALDRHRLALAAVAAGALILFVAPREWLPTAAIFCTAFAVAIGFAMHSFAARRGGEDLPPEEPAAKRDTAIWIGFASILVAFFLFADLGGFSGSLMTWEPESMRRLVEAANNDVSWLKFAASRLLWGQGLVSTGHDSLLFASGTYAIWQLGEISPTTLRLMPALLSAACLPVAYGVGRAIGGRNVATAALVVIALNPALFFYGRYGVSLTATFFAVLLLLWTCVRLFDPAVNGWRFGFLAAGAAFLATLGYAAGRVVAVALVMTTLIYGATQWRRLDRDRKKRFWTLVVALAIIWIIQAGLNRTREFITVRREHIMTTELRPEWVEELVGKDADPTGLTLNERLVMTKKVVSKTLPEMKRVLSFPFIHSTQPWLALGTDPPQFPLAQGPVLLFALWGFSFSIAAWRHRWPLLLVMALAAATLPLLLTNRVDLHRMSLAVIPVIVWAAVGLVAAARVMRECGVPGVVCNLVAASVLVLVVADNSTFLFYTTSPQPSQLVSGVHAEIDAIEGPVVVGISDDFKSEGEIELLLLERRRHDRDNRGEVLSQEKVEALTSDSGADPATVVRLEAMLHDTTVLLAPLRDFDATVDDLRARGMTAQAIGDGRGALWRLDQLPRGDHRNLGDGRP